MEPIPGDDDLLGEIPEGRHLSRGFWTDEQKETKETKDSLYPVVAKNVGRIANPSFQYRSGTKHFDCGYIAQSVIFRPDIAICVWFRNGRIGNPSYDEVFSFCNARVYPVVAKNVGWIANPSLPYRCGTKHLDCG